jgi:hypothetical protein
MVDLTSSGRQQGGAKRWLFSVHVCAIPESSL